MKAQQKSNRTNRKVHRKSKKNNQNNLNNANTNNNNNGNKVKKMRSGSKMVQKKTQKMKVAQRKSARKSVKKAHSKMHKLNSNNNNNNSNNNNQRKQMRSKGSKKGMLKKNKKNMKNKKSKAKKNQQKRRQRGGFMGSPLIAYASELPGDCESVNGREVFVPNFDSNLDEGNIKKCNSALDTIKDAEYGYTGSKISDDDTIDSSIQDEALGEEESNRMIQNRETERGNQQQQNPAMSRYVNLRADDAKYHRLLGQYVNGSISSSDLTELINLQGSGGNADNEIARNSGLVSNWNQLSEEQRSVFGSGPTQHAMAVEPIVTRP